MSRSRRINILWTPWRMSYISSVDKVRECIFCEAVKNPEKYYLVYETKHSIVMLNAYPYNTGHIMIAPKRHVPDLTLLSDEELLDLIRLLKRSLEILREVYNPHGFNIGVNIGRSAGAGFEDHVHVHVVPRWVGDTNFMPIISATKTIPEDLNVTKVKLREYFNK